MGIFSKVERSINTHSLSVISESGGTSLHGPLPERAVYLVSVLTSLHFVALRNLLLIVTALAGLVGISVHIWTRVDWLYNSSTRSQDDGQLTTVTNLLQLDFDDADNGDCHDTLFTCQCSARETTIHLLLFSGQISLHHRTRGRQREPDSCSLYFTSHPRR